MTECGNCGCAFARQYNWQRYCSKRCRLAARVFQQRLRFDQHSVWLRYPRAIRHVGNKRILHGVSPRKWGDGAFAEAMAEFTFPQIRVPLRIALMSFACVLLGDTPVSVIAAAALGIPLIGCKTPRPRVEIPDPIGTNAYLVYDGEKLIWRELVGGPSGAIDTTSHPGEIELIPAATAKYVQSPVSYAKEPAKDALAVFLGPGYTEQAIGASGMTASLLAIDNGVLKEGIAPARVILGWTGDTYVTASARVFVTFGSQTPAGGSNRVFSLPIAGKFVSMTVSTRGAQPASGSLDFTLAKAGMPIESGLSISYPSGAAAGVRHISKSGGVSAYKGDLIGIEIANNATANSAYFNSVALVFEF